MSVQTINLGNYANDGTGDDLRTAFQKVNSNFALLSSTVSIANGANLGSGVQIFAGRNNVNLEFKSLTSTDNSVNISNTPTTVDLAAKTSLENDPTPTLGADLSLNGYSIKAVNGGDVQANVYGIDVKIINSLLSILIETNAIAVDFGSFLQPTGYVSSQYGYVVDAGTFIDPASENQLDFGTF